MVTYGSAERESKNLHARTEKLDLELALGDGIGLSDQLIQPLFGDCAVALLVNVYSVSHARRLSVDQHAKSHGRFWLRRAHYEMKITRVKTIRDGSIRLVQHDGLVLDGPIARKRPIIQAQPRGEFINAWRFQDRPAGRRKVLCALIPDIVFAGLQAAPIGGRFETARIYRHGVPVDPARSRLGQQFLNDHFRLFVRTLTKMMVPNTPLRVDEV